MGDVLEIKSLLQYLPKRDIELGKKFCNNRDFIELQELVNSAIYIIQKNLTSETPKEEYKQINIEKLLALKSAIDTYCMKIDVEFVQSIDDDFDSEEEFENDFY